MLDIVMSLIQGQTYNDWLRQKRAAEYRAENKIQKYIKEQNLGGHLQIMFNLILVDIFNCPPGRSFILFHSLSCGSWNWSCGRVDLSLELCESERLP